MRKYLFLLTASLGFAAPSFAAETSEPAGGEEARPAAASENQITVLGNGFEQPVSATGQAVSVIDRDRLVQLQSMTIGDALKFLPGTSVVRRGPIGTQSSVFVRGGNSSQTLVLIDGVRVNDPSSPNAAFDFGSLLAGNVERIELLRGPNSVIWGSQAIGGVVNIVSELPTNGLTADGAAEYGYSDSALVRANIAGGTETIQASLGGTYSRTDGFSALTGGTEKDGNRTYALNGRVVVNLADNLRVDLRGYYTNARTDYDSLFSGGADALPVAHNRQYVGYAGLEYDLADGRWRNRAAYTRTQIDRLGTDPVVFSFNNYDAKGVVDRFEYRSAYEFSSLATLVAGVEHERIYSSVSYEGFPADVARNDVTGGYAQLSLTPVTGLVLTGGVRHDDYSDYGGQTTLGGNAVYSPNGGQTLFRATYGEGFRAPTLSEGQPPYGNLALKPETARNFDVGVEQHLGGDQFMVSATWFNRKSTNLITYNPSTFQSENIGKVDAEGFEFALELRPSDHFVFAGGYTLTNAYNRSGANSGKRLQLRPQHSAFVSADWKSPIGLTLGGDIQLVGDSFDDAANAVQLDGYELVTLRAAFPLKEGIELYGRIENLFDVTYETAAGYGSQRRAAYAGVRARF